MHTRSREFKTDAHALKAWAEAVAVGESFFGEEFLAEIQMLKTPSRDGVLAAVFAASDRANARVDDGGVPPALPSVAPWGRGGVVLRWSTGTSETTLLIPGGDRPPIVTIGWDEESHEWNAHMRRSDGLHRRWLAVEAAANE